MREEVRLARLNLSVNTRSCQAFVVPYINVQITKGATRQQKSQIVKRMTETLVEVLGKKPEHIHIVIQEIEESDWGYAGSLTDEWKQQQAQQQQ